MDRLENPKGDLKMTECYFCRGAIRPQKIDRVHHWGSQILFLKALPAEVCEDCGEIYFGPEALDLMDDAVKGKMPVIQDLRSCYEK